MVIRAPSPRFTMSHWSHCHRGTLCAFVPLLGLMAAVAWLRDQIFQDGVTLPAMVQVRFKSSPWHPCLELICTDVCIICIAWFPPLATFQDSFQTKQASKKLRILVTGGKMSKASAVARAVGRAGHTVFTAEVLPYRQLTLGHRGSSGSLWGCSAWKQQMFSALPQGDRLASNP